MANVKEMLEIGQECGLTTVSEAFDNYMNHYDCFFNIANYQAEILEFYKAMEDAKLLIKGSPSEYILNNMSIESALEAL